MISIHSFIKRMMDENGEEHYDEMEWRIVYDNNPNYRKYFTRGKDAGVFRFNFLASDVKIIIYPDENTRKISFDDKIIKEFFSQHTPITVTLDDCENF